MNLKDIDRKLGDMMKEEKIVNKHLDIPFKDFMPGQIIQSSQFNDDMLDIEDKVNEIIDKHNLNVNKLHEHLDDKENPHKVNPHQIGTYEDFEIDAFIDDVKNGNLNTEAITNRVLEDACVDNRVLLDGAVTLSKLDTNIGNQIDISNNMSIKERYTKLETDAIIQEKVGDGTYSKEQIDAKFEEYQAGTIVDGTINVTKLKGDVGRKLDIEHNPSISDRYTKSQVNTLIAKNGLPKDWGNLSDEVDDEIVTQNGLGSLPISDVMVCGEFKATETDVLNVKIQDVEFAKGEFNTLEDRLDNVDSHLSHNTNKLNNDKLFQVSIKDYDIPTSNDITDILREINNNAPSLGAKVYIPSDKLYIVSDEVIFTKPIILFSDRTPYRHNLSPTTTFGIGTVNNGCLVFRGNGSVIECLNVVGLEGNTNDGVRFEAGRPIIKDLSVIGHGGNGLVVGWNSDENPPININVNSFHISNLTAKKNNGYGCVIATKGLVANANAGNFSVCDIMNNAEGGILLNNAHMNVFSGMHIENNSGYGIKCENAGGNIFVRPYIEASETEDFYLDENSSKNIILGTRPGSGGVVQEQQNNFEIGTTRGTETLPYISEFLSHGFNMYCSEAGRWKTYSDSGRSLKFELTGTSATNGLIHFAHNNSDINVGFKLNKGTTIKTLTVIPKTLNIGSISANSTKDHLTGLTGYTSTTSVNVQPRTTLPSGLIWTSFVNESGEIVLRMCNTTSGSISVNSSFSISIISA